MQFFLKFNPAYLLLAIVVLLLGLDALLIYKDFVKQTPEPVYTLSFLLATLISILILCVFLISNRVSKIFMFGADGKKHVSKLRKRIIIAFSIGAALPTIIVAIFSIYFFNYGVEAWFDKKISKVLEQSIAVGEAYISEHIVQIKETSISVADDLNSMYYDLIHSPELFSRVLNAQAEMRSLDEAIVFQKNTNNILAQTNLSFSLSFLTIPERLIERADMGEIIKINSDPTKIRILIKLNNYSDTYLLIGRLINTKVIDHIDQSNGTATEYFRLKDNMISMQIKFSMVFLLLSLVLLLVAIIWGKNFAESIVKPIRQLVRATELVKDGDLSAHVPVENLKKDEVRILSSAFNRMISEIERQKRDLAEAERSLAWADVARRVAHEIKNPLTPIQLSAELLLKKFGDEISDKKSFEKYIQNILKHSKDIKNIVSEFVECAKLPEPIFTKCEIVSMVSDLIDSRKLINNSVEYNFLSNVKSFNFVCDTSQINAAIANLLLNAEEALAEFSTKNKKINTILDIKNDKVTISIIDNGPGFNPSLLKTAKDAYITTKSTGTGLGLAIVERIAQDHLGEIQISNSNNGGGVVSMIFNNIELEKKLK